MNFDFRFRNQAGKWEFKGHRKGADRAAAIQSLVDAGVEFPPGRYMSRPRGRQKDWDLFLLDTEGQIVGVDEAQSSAARV